MDFSDRCPPAVPSAHAQSLPQCVETELLVSGAPQTHESPSSPRGSPLDLGKYCNGMTVLLAALAVKLG
jgi:hypothetical protein